jgi:hypothetical protein
MQDIYYNPWADLDLNQDNQQSIPDTLPMEEELPTEKEAFQLALIQYHNAKDVNSSQEIREVFEETESTIISEQIDIFNNSSTIGEFLNLGKHKNYQNLSNKENSSLTTMKKRRKRKSLYDIQVERKLHQIRNLLQLGVNDLRLNKVLDILADIRFLLYPCLSKSFKKLDREFMKLYYAKDENSYNKLVKQVIKRIDNYYN